MNRSDRHFKPEIIKVRLSTPFLARTKCKFCNGSPSVYYYTYNPKLHNGPDWLQKFFAITTGHIKRLTTDWYLDTDPKYYSSVNVFFQGTAFKKYNSKIHHTRGIDVDNYIAEYLTCDCGKATWAFAEKAILKRPEIAQRKSRYKFPHKFEGW